ncbi:MAG: sigma-70 family RNA polymerase sigma factor [Lachnospiraceae bacterium]|nr:sigma-70 family RNA polymerase sigma factor [Lachnospiraceae bacterium]
MNKDEFTQKILALEKSTYHIAVTILKNDEDCADAMQNAILMAYKNLPGLRQKEFFNTWFTRILVNECYKLIRNRKPTISYEEYPEQAASDDEPTHSGVYEEIMHLSETHRLPFVLHYIEGYSVKEIAQILGISQGAVKVRLFRARSILKERLSD